MYYLLFVDVSVYIFNGSLLFRYFLDALLAWCLYRPLSPSLSLHVAPVPSLTRSFIAGIRDLHTISDSHINTILSSALHITQTVCLLFKLVHCLPMPCMCMSWMDAKVRMRIMAQKTHCIWLRVQKTHRYNFEYSTNIHRKYM